MKHPEVEFLFNDTVFDHRWGFLDTKFVLHNDRTVSVTGNRYLISGYKMPYLIPFVEEVTETSFNNEKREEIEIKLPPSKLPSKSITALKRKFNNHFTLHDRSRLMHSHGQTTADEVMQVLYGGKLKRYADGVLYCFQQTEMRDIMRLAKKYDFCLVPYGGGTSVSCSLSLPLKEKRPIVVVNTLKLSRIINLDVVNMRVTVEAGTTGEKLEQYLQQYGFTLGHEPDSMELSTVGGWIATNASGMKKNRYGNIEDIVEDFTLVTPAGEIKLSDLQVHPRVSMGMNIQKMLFGNEGNLGIITQATLKIFKLPEVKKYESIVFKDFETGVSFLEDLRSVKNLPASIRLVDNLQFKFGKALRGAETFSKRVKHRIEKIILNSKGFAEDQLVAATLVFEGSKEEVAAQKKSIARIMKKHKGMFGGSKNGERGYMLTYAIAYIRDFMSDHYIIGETYETTVPWNKIHEVCSSVAKVSTDLHNQFKFKGKSYVSARITQVYQTGVCIYFTHGLCYKGVSDPEAKFAKMEKEIRKTILEHGGSISHHHGIGKLRAGFASDLFSPLVYKVLYSLKKEIDPDNIMGIQNNVFLKK